MAGLTDTGPREVEFRRRWYEAHARRAQADVDAGHFRDWLPDLWTAGAEALEIRDRLASSGDLDQFKTEQDAWARANDVGFKGQIGAMFINSLVKNTDDRASVTRLLVSGLTAPADRQSAARKMDALVNHVNRIKVGANPAPLSAAFVLSYFWALKQPRKWPIFWPNDRKYLAASTGTKLSGSPTEQYLEFVDLVAELDDDCERFARVSSWWIAKQPVFLDPVLVDRCAYGMDPEAIPPEALRDNARALVSIAGHLGQRLVDDVSEGLGSSREAAKPPVNWKSRRPRSDLWADWRVPGSELGLRLWINDQGAAIGVFPGLHTPGWTEVALNVVRNNKVSGFRMMATQGSPHGVDVGFLGRQGSFIYGRYYEPGQLADLDLRTEVVDVAAAARPLLDALVRSAEGEESNGVGSSGVDDLPRPTDLAEAVAEFRRDRPYPTADDDGQRTHQPRLREMLLPGNLATTDRSDLRKIWTTSAYGHPGAQSMLNRSLRDADEAEYEAILRTIDYLCWGAEDDAARIDSVLNDPAYRVKGLGESVILKLMAVCHPDRYICVFPYSGKQGKLRMLGALELSEPSAQVTRGGKHVESNDRLRERLEPFFPEDPWGMMCFLYWYLDRVDREKTPVGEVDPLDAAATELLVERSFLDDIVELLRDKGQVILYGPPGTGKTFLAQRLAKALAPDPADRTLVQFHPSTSYEDFFEGYRPDEGLDGQIVYRLTPGPLARMTDRAAAYPQRRQVMVIDEINRANLPKALGELLYLLEYRGESISTLYRPDGEFELPKSLWFIGTMNTADKSIALVDAALRRRFHFVPFFPDRGPTKGLLDDWLKENDQPSWVGKLVAMVNRELTEAINADLQLGPSHFMKQGYLPEPDADDTKLRMIWEYNIEPLIEDQLFGDPDKIEGFRLESVVARYRSSRWQVDADTAGDSDPDPQVM